MVTKRETWGLLMKAASKSYGIVAKALGLIALLALIVLGITRSKFWEVFSSTPVLVLLGIVLFILFLFYVVELLRSVLDEYYKKAEISFYKISPQARIDKAYRVFHKFLIEGELLRNSAINHRQQWDRWIIEALANHCNIEAMHSYLLNTGRGSSDPPSPLLDENYEKAIDKVRELIKEDFTYSLN